MRAASRTRPTGPTPKLPSSKKPHHKEAAKCQIQKPLRERRKTRRRVSPLRRKPVSSSEKNSSTSEKASTAPDHPNKPSPLAYPRHGARVSIVLRPEKASIQ